MAVIRNNSDIMQCIGDVGVLGVGITWQPFGHLKGNDVITIDDDVMKNSLGILQLTNTPLGDGSDKMVFEVLSEDSLKSFVLEKIARLQKDKEDTTTAELLVEESGQVYEVYCMGETSGNPCKRVVTIALDGKQMPLCKTHREQTDRCEWDVAIRNWKGLRFKEEEKVVVDDSQDLLKAMKA